MEVLFSLELTESSKQTAFRNSAATPAMAWTQPLSCRWHVAKRDPRSHKCVARSGDERSAPGELVCAQLEAASLVGPLLIDHVIYVRTAVPAGINARSVMVAAGQVAPDDCGRQHDDGNARLSIVIYERQPVRFNRYK